MASGHDSACVGWRDMTGMLASVSSPKEADLVAPLGIDILDLKDPARGALGALAPGLIQKIVAAHPNLCISATLGDLPMRADDIETAARETARLGVRYVKIGFFPEGDWLIILRRLESALAQQVSLIAVLLADRAIPDLGWIPTFAASGFSGIMLDTADKSRGSLTTMLPRSFLSDFIQATQASGMISGLAGSLREEDIPALLPLGASYLGFRGALCESGRSSSISVSRTTGIIQSIRTASAPC